jgi:hypothetical protein
LSIDCFSKITDSQLAIKAILPTFTADETGILKQAFPDIQAAEPNSSSR